MKLVTFTQSGADQARLGCLVDGGVLALEAAAATLGLDAGRHFGSMQDLIEGGEAALELAREAEAKAPDTAILDPGQVHLLSPLPRPVQMRDFLCFEQHLVQAFQSAMKLQAMMKGETAPDVSDQPARGFSVPEVWYQQPIYYKCNRFAVSGPGDTIVWPDYSNVMDYELELACVIGRTGRDIPREAAGAYIFGYTIFNDFSARDAQNTEMQGRLGPAKGKDFDGANALGPCIVTADEIANPYDLTMIARVNGEEWSRGNSGTMHWTFEDLIAFVSRSETLHAGEIFGSGTVGGGCGLELMRFLGDGDTVELEIDGIGVLTNTVVREGS